MTMAVWEISPEMDALAFSYLSSRMAVALDRAIAEAADAPSTER